MASVKKPVRRGEVWLVAFDNARGTEIRDIRPALVIQNNIANEHSPLTIIAAISTVKEGDRVYPTEVFLEKDAGGLHKRSVILLNQIITVDNKRLHKKLGILNSGEITRINGAIEESLGLND